MPPTFPSPRSKSVFSNSNTSAPAFFAVIAAATALYLKLHQKSVNFINIQLLKIY
ncbi:hypothetical protein J2S18_001094 [Eubacterium multiforme]|uniref:Uncharacterized protein n=1 Tax=Eubacterium multiforme TaxID=83339 RepID=A0ABT9US74_9FIRM|nr:hypothetical protein [Eubacterium multiforme]